MKKTRKNLYPFVALLFVSGIMISACQTPHALAKNAPDYIAIENTLNSYLEINAAFESTYDDSRLTELVTNDPRGGPVSDEDVQLVRYMGNNSDLSASDIGFLDLKQEYYAYCRQTIEIYNQHLADGTLPDIKEEDYGPGELSVLDSKDHTPDPLLVAGVQADSMPEIQQMTADSGRMPCVPLPADRVTVDPFVIQSLTVDKDLAHAIGDFPYAEEEFVFALINGNWKLIGQHLIQWHAG